MKYFAIVAVVLCLVDGLNAIAQHLNSRPGIRVCTIGNFRLAGPENRNAGRCRTGCRYKEDRGRHDTGIGGNIFRTFARRQRYPNRHVEAGEVILRLERRLCFSPA